MLSMIGHRESFRLTLNRFNASRLKALRGKNGINNQSNRSGCKLW